MCVRVHVYVLIILYFYFQTIEDVNTDQLDEMIKMIMIVRTYIHTIIHYMYTLNSIQSTCAHSVTHTIIVGSDSSTEGEPGLSLYGQDPCPDQRDHRESHQRTGRVQ